MSSEDSMSDFIEDNKFSVAKLKLSFTADVMDANLSAALSADDDNDSELSEVGGGVREAPTRQELAIEGECLVRQGEYSEAVPLLEKAILLEEATDGLQSSLWNLLGKALFALGNFEQSAKCHAHELAVSLQIADEESQTRAYWNLGAVYREMGDLKRALICYEGYHILCEKLQGPKMLAKAHKNLGSIYLTLGRIALAVEGTLDLHAHQHLIKALNHLQKYSDTLDDNDEISLARTHENLGHCYEILRNFDKAIDHYQKCLKAAVATKNRLLEAQTFCYIGNCLKATLQPEKAIECYKRSLGIAIELGEVLGEATVHCNMAASYEMLCSLDTALEHYNEHYSAVREAGNLQGQALALLNVARLQEFQGNILAACEAWQEAVVVYKEMKKDSEVIDALAKIAKLKESHPTMGQRKPNVKGWKKFKKKVKRRSTINEPVQLAQSPVSSPTSSPVNSRHRSNSLEKKVVMTVSHDKQSSANKPPISSLVREPGKEKPIDKPLEDVSIGQQGSVASSTSSLSVQHSGSLEHEENTSVPSPPGTQQPVTNDNSQLTKQDDQPDNNIDMEVIPRAADDTEEKISLQEALDTLKDTTCIYNNDFGNREHQEEITRLFKMLEGDHLDLGPTDPSVLEDLNGWRLAPKENMIVETKESALI